MLLTSPIEDLDGGHNNKQKEGKDHNHFGSQAI
jgi:hypothetical protein